MGAGGSKADLKQDPRLTQIVESRNSQKKPVSFADDHQQEMNRTQVRSERNDSIIDPNKSFVSGSTRFNRSKSLAMSMSEMHTPMELGYQYLDYDSIRMITVQFMYKYDAKEGVFRILNDCSSYSVSNFSWQLFADQDIYEIQIQEVSNFALKQKPNSKILDEQTYVEQAIPASDKLTLSFDIDRLGKFLGMPDNSGVSDQIYRQMGIDPNTANSTMHENATDMIELKTKNFWTGLIDYWIPYREANEDQSKRNKVISQSGVKVQEGLKITPQDEEIEYRKMYIKREENPFKIRQHIQKKLNADENYKTGVIAQCREHPNVRAINRILKRDQALIIQKGADQEAPPKWVNNSTKFLDIDIFRTYETDMKSDDWRPFKSTQMNQRKMMFTIDDKYIFYDIQGDNKLVFLDWGDEMDGLINSGYINSEIQKFRDKNFKIVDQLRIELLEDQLLIK